MDVNAPIHRAEIVRHCFEGEGIARMNWAGCSPGLYPLEHLWDQLRRAVKQRLDPPSNRQELSEAQGHTR